MNRQVACLLLVLLASAFGCRTKSDEQSAPPAPNTAPPVPSVPPTSLPTPPQPPEAPSVPTEEDFEDEAAQQITSKNLEEELDKLERELKTP